MKPASLEQARAAKAWVRRRFARVGTVVGVGLVHDAGGYAIKVNLDAPPAPGADVPDAIDDVPVRVVVTGPIQPRD